MKINGGPAAYGIDGHLIDFGKEEEVNTAVLIYELLDFIDDVLDPSAAAKQ